MEKMKIRKTASDSPPANAQPDARKKARRGRKSLLHDPVVMKSLGKAIKAGVSQRLACEIAGIHPSTFCVWMKAGEAAKEGTPLNQFYKQISRIRATTAVKKLAIIQKEAETNWRAAAWFLERRFPEDWGRNRRSSRVGPNL